MTINPPYECIRRAWECAYVLRDEALAIADRVRVEEAYRAGPEALGWQDCREMFRLARAKLRQRA